MTEQLKPSRSPAQIIGHDAYTQLVFEGYTVLSNETIRGLRDCVEASIQGPRRDPKILSKRVGEMVPMPTFILKGQVLSAIRLLKEISQ